MTRDLLAGGINARVGSAAGPVLFRLDVEGRIVFWSEEARRKLGYSPMEVMGRSYGRLFPATEAAELAPARELGEAESNGRAECSGWRIRRDGGQVPAASVITAERAASGELVGFSVTDRPSKG